MCCEDFAGSGDSVFLQAAPEFVGNGNFEDACCESGLQTVLADVVFFVEFQRRYDLASAHLLSDHRKHAPDFRCNFIILRIRRVWPMENTLKVPVRGVKNASKIIGDLTPLSAPNFSPELCAWWYDPCGIL